MNGVCTYDCNVYTSLYCEQHQIQCVCVNGHGVDNQSLVVAGVVVAITNVVLVVGAVIYGNVELVVALEVVASNSNNRSNRPGGISSSSSSWWWWWLKEYRDSSNEHVLQ